MRNNNKQPIIIGMDSNIEKTDEEIVALVQQGDTEKFSLIVERYEEKLKRYARRFLYNNEDSEDLVQDIFIKAYTNLKSFDTKRRFSPWIYRIAHNEFINFLRKRHLEALPFFDPDTLFPHPVAKENSDDLVLNKEQQQAIEKSLAELPVKYRELVILYYFEDFDYKSIADILEIPVSTVGVRLKRAKDRLKKILVANNFTL